MKFLKNTILRLFSRKEIQEINRNLSKITVDQIINSPKYQNKKIF